MNILRKIVREVVIAPVKVVQGVVDAFTETGEIMSGIDKDKEK